MKEEKIRNSEETKVESKLKGNKKVNTKEWKKPTLEDVSEKVMAQPYIRFT
ncbi:MAG: hypothetical protein KKD90_01600 [Candidatus Omnitrophica bacterium]|nr:hypothetical protein [Candidatus Omnitrophota bacterium]